MRERLGKVRLSFRALFFVQADKIEAILLRHDAGVLEELLRVRRKLRFDLLDGLLDVLCVDVDELRGLRTFLLELVQRLLHTVELRRALDDAADGAHVAGVGLGEFTLERRRNLRMIARRDERKQVGDGAADHGDERNESDGANHFC